MTQQSLWYNRVMIKNITLTYIAIVLTPVIAFVIDEVIDLRVPSWPEFVFETVFSLIILFYVALLGSLAYQLVIRKKLSTTDVKTSQKVGTLLLSLLVLFMLFIFEAFLLFSLAFTGDISLATLFATIAFPTMFVLVIIIQFVILRLPKTL